MASRGDITLIGMPGAGKSTLGVVLAKRLGKSFVDTDLLIQERAGRSLAAIIADDGLEAFKELEERVLLELDCSNTVIATGGSAVYGQAAMEHLRSLGTVVYIKVSLDELSHRLGDDLAARGVAASPDAGLAAILDERAELYRKHADIAIDTDGLEPFEAVDALVAALDSWRDR